MPIPPQLIMLAAQLALQGANMGFQQMNAKKQEKEGRAMSGLYPRPEYEVPKEVGQVTANQRMLYNSPDLIGGDTLRKQQAALQGAALEGILKGGAGAGNVMAAITALNANANKGAQDIQVEQNLQRLRALEGLNAALGQEAEYETKAFDYNKNQPYQNAQLAAQAQIAASMKQKDNTANLGSAGVLGMMPQLSQLMKDPKFMEQLAKMMAGMGGDKTLGSFTMP